MNIGTILRISIASIGVCTAAGCIDQPRVAIITSTMVGLEAKPPMMDAQPNPSVSLAYKRAEMAIVPVCRVPNHSWLDRLMEPGLKPTEDKKDQLCPPNSSDQSDAYAVLGSFKMAHNWFGPLNIRQFIATGSAARHLVASTVHMVGAVKNPGHYPFTKGLTLDGAIALAGGRVSRASHDLKDVRHNGNPPSEKDITEGKFTISPDDIIEILEAEWFHISGAVKNPGRKPYEKGLTLERALLLAGERTNEGKTGKVKATHVGEKDRDSKTRELGPGSAIMPDDIIVVEPSIPPLQ